MLKERLSFYRRVNFFSDTIITGLSYVVAMFIKGYSETGLLIIPKHILQYDWVLYVVMFLWPLLLNMNGLYPANRLRTTARASGIIVKSSIQGLLVVFAILFITKIEVASRFILLIFGGLVTSFLVIKESIILSTLHLLRESGANLRNVVVIGSLESAKNIIKTINEHSFLGLNIVGLLVPAKESHKEDTAGCKIIGKLEEIEKALHKYPIDHVIITIDRKDYKEVDDIIFHCEQEGKEIWVTASIFNIKIARLDSDELFGEPIFVLRTGPKFSWELFTKDVLDRVGGFIFSLLSAPIIAIAAILVKLTSKGPAIYKQTRCGLHGRMFTLYKLRSMHEGAEKELEKLKEKSIMKGPAFKINRDPRITPIGRILRKFSIDEMPQFWNALRGDMSLIGPRPPLPEEVSEYKGWQRRRLSMKPGITGLWQVSGRSKIVDFDKLAELDLKYIDSWSLWLDFKIFLMTILVVISTRGAK